MGIVSNICIQTEYSDWPCDTSDEMRAILADIDRRQKDDGWSIYKKFEEQTFANLRRYSAELRLEGVK